MGEATAELEAVNTPIKKKRRHGWWLAAPVLGIIALGWLANGPRTTPYTSPPFDDPAVRFRIELPPGWEVSHFKAIPGPLRGRAELLIGEADPDWRPCWLRKWLPRDPKPLPFMLVQVYKVIPGARQENLSPPALDGSQPWKESCPVQPAGGGHFNAKGAFIQIYLMGRHYFTPNRDYEIHVGYYREDREQLKPTLDVIGKTIRIVR